MRPVHHLVYAEDVVLVSVLLQTHRLIDIWLYDHDSATQAWQARVWSSAAHAHCRCAITCKVKCGTVTRLYGCVWSQRAFKLITPPCAFVLRVCRETTQSAAISMQSPVNKIPPDKVRVLKICSRFTISCLLAKQRGLTRGSLDSLCSLSVHHFSKAFIIASILRFLSTPVTHAHTRGRRWSSPWPPRDQKTVKIMTWPWTSEQVGLDVTSLEIQEEESDFRAVRGFCGLIMVSSQYGAFMCFYLHTTLTKPQLVPCKLICAAGRDRCVLWLWLNVATLLWFILSHHRSYVVELTAELLQIPRAAEETRDGSIVVA